MRSAQLGRVLGVGLATVVWVAGAGADDAPTSGLVASISPVRTVVPIGEPVLVDLILANVGADPVTLKVPGTTAAEQTDETAGLPIEHVFSATGFHGVTIWREANEPLGERVVRPVTAAPVVTLAPGDSIDIFEV